MLKTALKPLIEGSALATAYRHLRDSRDLHRPIRKTRFGFLFSGPQSMVDGTFEPDESLLVKELLERSDALVNVGAHYGYYCCLALQAGKHVVAFEPIKLNVDYLLSNIEANGWSDNAEVFPIAVGAAPGIAEIYGGNTGASLLQGWSGNRQREGTRVPVSSLDKVIGSSLSGQQCLVIIDVEGSELAVLEGAGMLLAQEPKPTWLIEIMISEHQPNGQKINPRLEETFTAFFEHGYQAVTANRERRIVSAEEISAIVRTGRDTLGCHNFLFSSPDA